MTTARATLRELSPGPGVTEVNGREKAGADPSWYSWVKLEVAEDSNAETRRLVKGHLVVLSGLKTEQEQESLQ